MVPVSMNHPVNDYCLDQTHHHPTKVFSKVEPAVTLPICIQLGDSEQRLRFQVLFKYAKQNDRQGSEEDIEHGQVPRLVNRRARVAVVALELRLDNIKDDLFPECG